MSIVPFQLNQANPYLNMENINYQSPQYCPILKSSVSLIDNSIGQVYAKGYEILNYAEKIFKQYTGYDLQPLVILGPITVTALWKAPAFFKFIYLHPAVVVSTVAIGAAYYGGNNIYNNSCKGKEPIIESELFLNHLKNFLQSVEKIKLQGAAWCIKGSLLDSQIFDAMDYILKHPDTSIYAINNHMNLAKDLSTCIGIRLAGNKKEILKILNLLKESFTEEQIESLSKALILIDAVSENTVLKLREILGIKEVPADENKSLVRI